jgi:hypothetical protein
MTSYSMMAFIAGLLSVVPLVMVLVWMKKSAIAIA